ncbi:hypothetical protein [Roseibium aggregatum]|uniref:CheA signal transduction histidine kinase n=1 Tax=Roseibium aggregatum TaxID=187304 RepID=A0A939J678_9HYPH|nr:hypothetical protein [Roseibium aggregatum]MBN9672509.1 hypothetical protein [Roseibium aggregatum]
MADYYSILKKTITSLPESNGAARRSVYSRARNAIVNQLKAYEPPLSPSEITAEQLRLEEAIRKVEAEAARESLGLGPVSPKPQSAPPEPAAAEEPTVQAEEPRHQAPEPEYQDAVETAAAPVEEEPAPSPLKETLSEASALGSAANQAVQNAKEAVEPESGNAFAASPQTRQEPAFSAAAPEGDGPYAAEPEQTGAVGSAVASDEIAAPDPDRAGRKPRRTKTKKPSAGEALRGDSSSSKFLPIALAGLLVLAIVAAAAYFLLPAADQIAVNRQETPATGETPETQSRASTQPDRVLSGQDPDAGADDDPDSSKNTDRLLDDGNDEVVAPDARTVTTTTITPDASGEAPEAQPAPIAAEPSAATDVENALEPEVPAIVAADPAQAADALAGQEENLALAVPEQTLPAAPAAVSSSGAQRSILYEEGEEAGGSGTAAEGAVVWELDEETTLDGKAQTVLNASVEIPERDVKVDIRIKPNEDTSLPASHLVEIKYEFPQEFAPGDVVNVPGLVMKPTEEARGDALIGASVKVSPGFFWIALSSLPNERQRNLALLRERGWIDIPMLYENGKRGILTLEKGSVGADAVEKAISSWQAG